MSILTYVKRKRNISLALLACAVIALVVWYSSDYVQGFRTIKTAHIFATEVSGVGWENAALAKIQELPANAPLPAFTTSNSAWLKLAATELLPISETATSTPATTTELTLPIDTASSTESASTTESIPETTAPTPAAEELNTAPVNSEDVPQSEIPVIEPELVPVTETTASSTSMRSSWLEKFSVLSMHTILSWLGTATYATTTPEEAITTTEAPPPGYTEVASCIVTGESCYIIELKGFATGEDLRSKNFESARLNFSFAYRQPETDLKDDRLVVHYFRNGEWRVAGEVYLNKELSNATNGGFFTAELEDVEEWEDIEDLTFVVEYEHINTTSSAEVYLDSAWVEALYREPVEEVLQGTDEEPVVVPENVVFTLEDSGIEPTTLVLPSGEEIRFSFTDDVKDTLLVRTDKKVYGGAGDVVYASLTNTGSESESVRLYTAFPRAFGSLTGLSQFMRNVPRASEQPIQEDVTYLCEAGWVNASSSSPLYRCEASGQMETCIALNEDRTNCSVERVEVGAKEVVTYESDWLPVPFTNQEVSRDVLSKDVAEGYTVTAAADGVFEVFPGQTIFFRLEMEGSGNDQLQFALLAEGTAESGDVYADQLQEESTLRTIAEQKAQSIAEKKGNARIAGKADFDGDEKPSFTFKFTSQRGLLARGFNALLGRGNEFAVGSAKFVSSDGVEREIPVTITYGANGEWTLTVANRPREFRPGKYTATVTLREGTDEFTESIEFYWGTLALNLDASAYGLGDTVSFQMGALADTGDTICDADLGLFVTAPSGAFTNVPVRQSGSCGDNNIVDVADYLADLQVNEIGRYSIALSMFDEEGDVLHHIIDSFDVSEGVPFTIARAGATRINPIAAYTMDIALTATTDVVGEFIEAVPADFEILEHEGAEIKMFGSAKRLVWPVNLKAGETMRVSYSYDAPDISPYLYLLGPAEVRSPGGASFEEPRAWKLASDATGNMLLFWDSTFIPTGWTCVSCSPSHAFYQRFIVGSSTAGVNGGAATHTHTATGAVAASSGSQSVDTNNQATPTVAHTHTYTPTISAPSNLPPYRQLAVIQYNSTGEPPSIPTGAIAIFDTTVPSGWTRYSAQDGTFIRSESTSTIGTTGGSATHTHTITGNTGASAGTANIRNPGTSVTVAAAAHTHSVSTSTGSVNNEPPYIEVILGKLNATTTAPNGMIAMWSDEAPVGWDTISSSTEPFENRFLRATSTYGGTGGASTHTHSNITGITSGAPSATVTRDSTPATTNVASQAHTHSVSVTSFSTDSHLPPYRTAVFAKRDGGAPPTFTLHDIPFDNEKTGTSTPWFEFTANDPDGSDTLTYQIQWDDDADLDSSPLGDRTSSVETGCSPNCFQNLTTPSNNSPFNDNQRIRFTIQSSLVSGTTYYWRVRAKETSSSQWGSWATTTSFTYIANTEPSQWLQTQDAQFDTNTLSGAETYGSDAARLSIIEPSEALIAYGEGVVQTPRYRFWSGSAWSAEASAQSVGGTIQWIATKGAPTRDEYLLATLDSGNDVNVQVYDGNSDTWGNLTEVVGGAGGVSNNQRRGMDVTYETSSGDGMIVYCDGDADPSYRIWNGATWSAATTINLSSANNCEYIALASDPQSDEIILVARDTGTQYEVQVWSGSAWGNSKTIGSMSDVANEGIAVNYEESGDQAIVAVSNGLAASIAWTAWNGTEWSVNSTQGLGDDFEWGTLRRDVGSDNMALCYVDQDSDVGVLRWDGNAWIAFSERDTVSNGNTGRPIDCAFETTTGRDGYIMVPYSDSTNARYQFWNGSSYSTEASISTIQDSITVETVRTGDGVILSVFNDDTNTQFDFSSWNGSSWSTIETLETSPSVTVAPFMQPFSLAPQVYQASTGSMTSTVIDFDVVPGRPSWGEVLWTTTEPTATDVTVQVMYETGGVCNTLVPDLALPGNSAGFQATSSPLNISSLATSTYNRICLKANFSTTGVNAPSLNEWSVSWERQPYLTQTHFRWYANAATSLTPTDPWPSGGTDLVEDTAIPTAYSPSPNEVLRLRLGLLVENTALSTSDLSLKLQYAEGTSCSASLTWRDVGAIGSTTAKWRGYDNASLTDGATLPSTLLANSDARATYEEANDSSFNPLSASVNDEVEWDWVVQHNASSSQSFCFRAVTSGNVPLNEYDLYPSLITNSAPATPTQEKPFDYEMVASTTPWFEFVADDPESDDITYQIQIDDDYLFGSPLLTRDSQTNLSEFSNIVTPADKDPFTSAQSVRFIPTTALTNGTTYYWRVRGKDRNKSNEWSSWSDTYSVTINTSVTITSWRQTTFAQFDRDTHDDTEATSTDDVVLTSGFTSGTTTGPTIDYDWKSTGNSWGSLSWTDTETSSDILYHVEYYNGTDWALIPDADLSGNAAGFDTSPISLLSVSPITYNQIRLRANLTNSGATPRLHDWTVQWGLAVEAPTLEALFDNEKTGTTTPTFRFYSTDPESNDLQYEISWSTSNTFTSSTTRQSGVSAGFTNLSSTTDSSPFTSGNTIQFQMQSGDALTNNTTYWWRARARDPGGSNVWSVWSELRSFTVDTTVDVSTWFQTTDEQFETDTLNDIETTGSDSAQITSINREAFMAYAEGTVQVPRFRLWNGSVWGNEQSALSIGDTIRFVETAASPTRDEYLIATMGSTGVVDAQIIDGATDTAGNIAEISAVVPDTTQRGFDVAYESDSGDALVVACVGTEAVYRVWNGTSWSATSSLALSVSANCEWIKLASDPASDEIILVARDATTGATDYEALVWNGSSWGNSMTMGSQVTVANEGIAIEYEESGGQAIVAVSNGANNNFIWNSWNGSSWAGTNTVVIGNDFQGGRIARDEGSDAMALCYVDLDSDIGYVLWDGSAWGTSAEFETLGNSTNGRPISCEYETVTGRDGYVMMPYSDTTLVEYVFWNGSTLSTAAALTTISDAAEIRTARTGDDKILVFAYDDANTEYDFSYWDGSTWSTEQVIDTTSITTVTPFTIPLDIVARQYPAITTGSVVSSSIDFDDGTGLKWDYVDWVKTTPGSSNVVLQVEYLTSTSTWALVPNTDLPGNAAGTTTSPLDLSNLNYNTYNTLRTIATLNCVSGNCPILNDWTVAWSPGLEISGTAKQYDQTTNVTSGTVAVAVNGTLQIGKTGAISGGNWSISNVTVFPGDVVTVFIESANDANEAVAVTVYDGVGDISGLELYERHVSIGSSDNATVSNANLSQYDNSVSGDEDVIHDVDAGNDLTACALSGCSDVRVYVKSGNTYRPDSASSGNIATHDIRIDGTLVGDGNTITVSGTWDNNSVFTPNTSTVIFTATSTSESVDTTGASSYAFNNVTFGQTSGSATWSLATSTDINGNLSLQYGTLTKGAHALFVAGNLSIGANGIYQKGTGGFTFDGSGSSTWTDSTASKQDLGAVTINGSVKTIQLGSNVKATDITIGADDTLNASASNYAIEVQGNWTNNNLFVAQGGTVNFTATTTGKTITAGSSSFNNLVFNGSGGNWSFSGSTLGVSSDFTISAGTVTMPTATTTVGGNFDAQGGTFMHNNGVVSFTASTAKTLRPSTSSFYDLSFAGSGSWSFLDANATSSRHTIITAGTVTLPSGTLAVGGSFAKNAGSFTHNSGTLRFTASGAQTIRLNNSDAYNLTFAGSGSWSFIDTNATSTNTLRFENGTATLPSGTLAVGGSWTVTSGIFTHNSGTVKFNSADTGETINPGSSSFGSLLFDGASGGWTVSNNATSTSATTLVRAADFTVGSGVTLAVQGTFTNSIGGATTTWTGSTLSLTSGTAFSINSKTASGDSYGTIRVGSGTQVKMWNSSASSYAVNSSGYLYSQDHAAVDGSLYIWGSYRTTSDEYWNYANDFDGTVLTGVDRRQANVRIANGSSVGFSTGILRMQGDSAASTTIANQGSGTYGFSVTNGTVSAQYYDIKNTDATGLSLQGTTSIASLSNGTFELSVASGGTSITAGGTVIDANPTLQIQHVGFATSSGVTSGFNVTATGTPTSYWWFRNSYGTYDGEAFDSDPGGDPGNVRWDDSGFTITVAGRVYSDHGSTAIGNPPCDGSTPVVRVVVSGQSSYTGSCNAATGAYSIPNVVFSGDAVLTAYLNTNGGARAVAVTRTPTTDITNLDLYQNVLIVRHESVSPITIETLATYDASDDSDLNFSASTSTNTLTVQPEHELHVWTGKTFTPGGNVTLQSGGSGNARDGRLHIDTSATFTAQGSESHSIGGGFIVESGATFTPANSTLTFTATTTGKVISSASALSLYNIVFNGAGGGWSLGSAATATTTVQNAFTMTAGTLSGTSSLVVQSGTMSGDGSIAMTGGTVRLEGAGNFGGASSWQFHNLTFGNSSSTATTTKSGAGTTNVRGVLTIGLNHVLQAGSALWNLSGGGTPFVPTGRFYVQTAPFTYSATTSAIIADETYTLLTLAPSGSGSPTFTLEGGTFTTDDLVIGDGTNAVTVTVNTNDPTVIVTDDVTISTNATLVASNVGAFEVGGSWANSGTFTHSNGSVLFDSTDSGETISAGSSSFYDLSFDNAGGGWTIGTATTTRHLSLLAGTDFTLSSGATLSVGGTFTNAIGGPATTWTNSTLALVSGTGYSINTSSNAGDTYGTLNVGANTDVRMWSSSASTTNVSATGSLYSQDHAGVNGDLYIWGAYEITGGSDYWSYETDFDGTSIASTSRQVDVRIAPSSSVTLTSGVLDILGAAGATTTIAVQGSGTYSFDVAGGTLNASYYQVRNTDAVGLNFSGTPTVTSLSNGDFELGVEGGTLITVDGSVIDQNPLKIFMRNRFATSTGITAGYNVTATGSSVSSWKFNLHYGGFDGEANDSDVGGDPGLIRWDDSATDITIAGNVYSDEGTTVSSVCDNTTQVVVLKVEGAGSYTSSCNATTGAYSIPDVSFNPGDALVVFLNTGGGARAANVSKDPSTNIANMHLYENRVIVRHEDTSPLTIADMSIYDTDQDSDIPFDAEDSATDTLTLPPEKKLIIWDSKTLAPAGNITLESGGSGSAWDGTLELKTNAIFSAASTQSHSIGGSLIVGSGGGISGAQSTFTFTATTTGKTITPGSSSFYNIVFNGSGGNWAFSGGTVSAMNDFTISAGTVTLPTATTTVGGSFSNTGGTFMHNNGILELTASSSGKSVRGNGSSFYSLFFNGSGGAWTMQDTNATSSNNFTISAGTVTLPSGTLAVGGSFVNTGTFAHASGVVKLYATAAGKTVQASASSFYNLLMNGSGGEWTWLDTSATTTNDFTITNGSTTLPTGTLAIGGSFINSGVFNHAGGTVKFNASTTGKSVTPGSSSFAALLFNNASGGWTITANATSTGTTTLAAANSFTLASGATLSVGGVFTNSVGGAATTWTNSTLVINASTTAAINTKTNNGDSYGTLVIGPNTDISMWKSSAATTSVYVSGSLYSQDHADVDGDLHIWGDYNRSSGNEYWSYATDFDGTALGGSSRQVDVRIASSSNLTFSGGTFEILGTASATTTVAIIGSGAYGLEISGGTFNANYYQIRNTDSDGLTFSGAPTVTSLSYGDFELAQNGGAMLTVASTTIDANASKQILNVGFGTSTGISSGFNVVRVGTSTSAWNFSAHSGSLDGEAFDNDGGDACGYIRWSDSSCLFVSQEHYRWRNDDGGEAVPNSEWYNASWSKRKRLTVLNQIGTAYTNFEMKVTVSYDADMQTDFEDLRFTDSSGTTSIDYWIEEVDPGVSAIVWVEIPTLPASDDAVLYMYYGNAGASDAGSGTATFNFFDDFEDDNITEYSGNTTRFNVGTSFNHNYTYGLDAFGNEDQFTTGGIYRTGSLTAQGNTIRYFQYIDSTTEDEPCALFGVQGSGSNYAVCLDQYPNEIISIAENVSANDDNGTIIASTTVTFATGWYEVEIDWLTNNSINVSVYDDTGALFATVSGSDSSYTSGGMGFTYWFQNGGWDFYSARQYVASDPTYAFGSEQGSSGASWRAAEDTYIGNVELYDNLRLRFSIENTGDELLNQQFRLQYAEKGAAASCAAVPFDNFSDVPTATAGCGSSPACMSTSTQFVDQADTTQLLSATPLLPFTAGKLVEDPSNQSNGITFSQNRVTEVEFNFQLTISAVASAYCFRAADGASSLDNYETVAEVQLVHLPFISNFSLNGGLDITLTEGATTTVMATGTVTDNNGYADIVSATSTIYRSDLTANCAADPNSCYQISASSCSFTNCAGNSCDFICSAQVEYIATPTDTGSFASQNWVASVQVYDSTDETDIDTSLGVELLSLFGLRVNSDIDFGSLGVGENTGATNTPTTVINTGNTNIDIELEGTDLTGGSSTIPVGQQKYATTTFVYSSCTICNLLTGSATNLEVDLPKPTSTSTPVTTNVYWGINIPLGTAAMQHTGTNTFWATAE